MIFFPCSKITEIYSDARTPIEDCANNFQVASTPSIVIRALCTDKIKYSNNFKDSDNEC